jgi:general secretion pathway protein M
MSIVLPPMVSRALALAILISVIGFFWFGAIQPLLDIYGNTQFSIERNTTMLARYRQVASALQQRQSKLALLKQQQATAGGFLRGTSETLVGAEIQNRIKTLAEAAHGELKSTQILPVQEDGKFRRITVRGQMSLGLEAAQRLFYGLESNTPMLFLDNVNIRARSESRRQSEATDEPILDVRFDVYGYMPAK